MTEAEYLISQDLARVRIARGVLVEVILNPTIARIVTQLYGEADRLHAELEKALRGKDDR